MPEHAIHRIASTRFTPGAKCDVFAGGGPFDTIVYVPGCVTTSTPCLAQYESCHVVGAMSASSIR